MGLLAPGGVAVIALALATAVLVLGGADATAQPRRHVLWLDFAGGAITPGEDTAAGEAPCIPSAFRYPMFLGSGPAAAAAVEEARRILAPYGVVVRASPPPSELPFTHVRLGGSPDVFGVDEGLNGLSCRGVDCGDGSVSDTVFVFSDRFTASARVLDPGDQRAAGITLGRIAVHEAAHAWGLEHAGSGTSIMAKFPSAAPEQGFSRGCEPLDLVTDSVCPDERERHCPVGAQDAHAEMLARFGEGGPDDVPPTLEIVAPPDGDTLSPGDTIVLEVDVDDDRGEVGWSLRVPELEYTWVAPPGEREVELVLPEGSFTLQVRALDPDGNVARAQVQVHAHGPAPDDAPPQSACACRSRGAKASSLGMLLGFVVSLLLCRRPAP